MATEVFADTVGRAEFAAGMIRIELASIEPGEEGAAASMVVRQRVIMPIDGFLSALGTLNGLAEKLAEAGVIRRAAPAATGTTATVVTPTAPVADSRSGARPQSPNFG
ncbi:hypothetical protein WCLP8_3410002 [uncultured Gammaproteobacteria bacterium]